MRLWEKLLPPTRSDVPPRRPLDGHLVVFTGKLSSLGRKDARALVERLGGATADDVNAKTTILVVGAEGFGTSFDPDRTKSHKLVRAEELNLQKAAEIRVLTEEQFCVLADVPTPDALKRQYHSMRDLLGRYRRLREDHLRYLVKCGLIRPVLRTNAETFFSFSDVALLKRVHDELVEGASFKRVVRSLLQSSEGQLAFDFRLDAEPARIVTLQPRAVDAGSRRGPADAPRDRARAEDHFRRASALDDGVESTRGEAAAAYRRALECDPYLVAALINLANIHYSGDELAEAQALYERAIGLEPDFFEAHFNLGNIYHDLGRFPEAEVCYREALRLNPLYADTHFYLAVTLEKTGQSDAARPHWRSYQELEPHGEWVELAREFSE